MTRAVSTERPEKLVRGRRYWISPAADAERLRNREVLFLGKTKLANGPRVAQIAFINPDGSKGEEWLANPAMIIPL